MRSFLYYLFIIVIFTACSENTVDPPYYTSRQLEYPLHQASEYDYNGKVIIREFSDGGLELKIELNWEGTSYSSVDFPAHLHFGSVGKEDAPMAFMLNPVNSMDLVSETRLGKLADGTTLDFDSFQNFDGHVKVHLASEGPDYKVILVAGNVGKNYSELQRFKPEDVAICLPY